MDSDKTKWGRTEWQAYALALEQAHQSALDGWGVTVDELEQHSALLKEYRAEADLMRNHIALLQKLQSLQPPSPQLKKNRGRPRKNGLGISDLDLFESIKADYLKTYPNTDPSDKDVIEWSFARMFERHGMRASRVKERRVQGQIKTFQNRVSNARHPYLPKKSR